MKHINADRPKNSMKEDRLGYVPFAQAVAKAIRLIRSDEGMVLAIHGPWGSGKTSAVNMVVEELETASEADQNQKPIVVRFNPWWFSGQQDLTKAFFSELSIALRGKGLTEAADGLKKVLKRVLRNREAVLGLVDLIPLPGTKLVTSALDAASNVIEQELENEKSLDEERSSLCDALKKQGHRILVIVDDLDRLPADEARQIFRLVKSVADLPNVTYLLVFDRSIVEKALQGDVIADGQHWLEKIVQASFDLPPIHKLDLRDFFLSALEEAVGEARGELGYNEQQHWNDLYLAAVEPWLKTPREVTRLCNALVVSYPPVAREVNFADFVALETLRLFEPKLHSLIREEAGAIDCWGHDKKYTGIWKRLINSAQGGRKDMAEVTLRWVLPIFNNNVDNMLLYEFGRQKRFCIDRHLPSYFIFSAGEDAITNSEWGDILDAFKNSDTALSLINDYRQKKNRQGRERGELLLEEFRMPAGDIPNEQLGPIVRTFLQVSDAFLGSDASPRYGEALRVAAGALIDRLPVAEREAAISDALSSALGLKFLTALIFELAQEHGHLTARGPFPEHQRRLPEEAVRRLEEKLKEKLAAAAESGDLLEQPEEMTVWFELVGRERAKAYTDSHLANNESCIKLIAVVDFALSRKERYWLKGFLDTARLAERLKAIRESVDAQLQERIDECIKRI